MTKRIFALLVIGLVSATVLPLSASALSVACGSGISLRITGTTETHYSWRVSSTHTCVPDAAGTLTVGDDSGYVEEESCTGSLQCENDIGGVSKRGDCVSAFARGDGEMELFWAGSLGCVQ